jgi:hypothetical protein
LDLGRPGLGHECPGSLASLSPRNALQMGDVGSWRHPKVSSHVLHSGSPSVLGLPDHLLFSHGVWRSGTPNLATRLSGGCPHNAGLRSPLDRQCLVPFTCDQAHLGQALHGGGPFCFRECRDVNPEFRQMFYRSFGRSRANRSPCPDIPMERLRRGLAGLREGDQPMACGPRRLPPESSC